MPSGKRARQRRRTAGGEPPPVRSKGGGAAGLRLSRRALLFGTVAVLVAIGLGVGLGVAFGGGSSGNGGGGGGGGATAGHLAPLSTLGQLVSPGPRGPPGPEGPPLERGRNLAPAGAPAPGSSVDGIQCAGSEQVAFHIHSRLTVYVDGHSVRVPYGVGIARPQPERTPRGIFVGSGACFAWLHTHAADGIIHIESPVHRTFTLGNFFDVWGQPLSRTRVGPERDKVTALFDGKVWRGNPRSIPLEAHSQIQLDVGRPLVAPVRIKNWYGL